MDKTIHSQRYLELTALLRVVRERNGLSQAEVARLIDKPQSFVSKYENGSRRLDIIEFVEVARAIGAPLHILLEQIEKGYQ